MRIRFIDCFRRFLLIVGASLVGACGSGGGGGEVLPPLPPAPVAPAISTQPSAASVLEGQPATFAVVAAGTSLQYQWRRDGTVIAGATAATYTLTAAALVDNGARYSVVVSNTVGADTSQAAVLTVTPLVVAPTLARSPVAASVLAGSAANFDVLAAGTAPFAYQWFRNGAAIAGAVRSDYSLVTTSADNNAQFSVRVSNSAGAVTSAAVALTVTPQPVGAPTLVRAPATASVVAGSTASFDVLADGTGPLTYQWLRGGAAIAGAVQPGYSLVTTLADNEAQFSVRVSNSAGSVTSSAVSLRVTAQFVPLSIAVQPVDVTVRAGENATIAVVLGGTGPFTWSWIRNGVDLGIGVANTFVNTPSFVFTPALLADNGTLISLRVTDSSGTITTRQAQLTVLP